MNKLLVLAGTAMAMAALCGTAGADTGKGGKIDGKKEFEEHCNACHINGGNAMNPAKTLHKKAMEANGIRTAKDIIAKMRNPGPGMTRFDEKTVSNAEAKAIADYVLKAFK